ncbi:MAG: hypothetical protein JW994_07695 [Candidatus Omnitrophica bacterium]|nr:hypothetical protein [Candidatus Omnitrophota bacterium]
MSKKELLYKISDTQLFKAALWLFYPLYYLAKKIASLLHRIKKLIFSQLLLAELARKNPRSTHGKRVFIEPGSEFLLYGGASVKLGDNVNIDKNCLIKIFNGATLSIDDNVYMGPYTHIYISNDMTIGRDVIFGPFCFLIDHDHEFGLEDGLRLDRITSGKNDRIIIGERVWLGTKTTVTKGVTIGDHSVIGAGAVVTRDIKPNSVAVGVPAREIKSV